jgi:hypothetical protein
LRFGSHSGVLSRKFSELIENATISDRASREELLLFCKMHLVLRQIKREGKDDLLVIEIVSEQGVPVQNNCQQPKHANLERPLHFGPQSMIWYCYPPKSGSV